MARAPSPAKANRHNRMNQVPDDSVARGRWGLVRLGLELAWIGAGRFGLNPFTWYDMADPPYLPARDFHKDIVLAPERQPHQPILPLQRPPGGGKLLGRKNPGPPFRVRPGDAPARRARGHQHARVIADALVLPRIIARHHVEPALLPGKPKRRAHRLPVLAKAGQAQVFLPP